MSKVKQSEQKYIDRTWFIDRDTEIRARTTTMVTTKTRHRCALGEIERRHVFIKPGSRALYERAVVDGEWGQFWICVPCMDANIKRDGR